MHNRIKELLLVFFIAGILFCGLPGCDSGKKVVDEVTGNRALKQYEKAKEDLKAIEEKEKEKYDAVSDEENQEDQKNKE